MICTHSITRRSLKTSILPQETELFTSSRKKRRNFEPFLTALSNVASML